MKKLHTDAPLAIAEQMDKLREELRRRIAREELESKLRLEALDQLLTALNVDVASFRTLWLLPLLAAGASFETALACIAQSHFQPN
jgi:predicted RNA-binding Zn ribbon-like protein